jgi:hypothetical protein
MPPHPAPSHYDDDEEEEEEEEEEEYSDQEEEEEDYSDSAISSDNEYGSDQRSVPPPDAADFIHFGSSLTVKGIGDSDCT